MNESIIFINETNNESINVRVLTFRTLNHFNCVFKCVLYNIYINNTKLRMWKFIKKWNFYKRIYLFKNNRHYMFNIFSFVFTFILKWQAGLLRLMHQTFCTLIFNVSMQWAAKDTHCVSKILQRKWINIWECTSLPIAYVKEQVQYSNNILSGTRKYIVWSFASTIRKLT